MKFYKIKTLRGRSEAGYRAGLSRRRSRVRAPSLPQNPFWFGRASEQRNGYFFRAIAQLVARYVRDVEVPGSNPGCPIFSPHYKIIPQNSDNQNMKLNVVMPIVGEVLKSPVVIGTAIVVLLYLNFVFFVARYKKQPPKPRKPKIVAPVAAPPVESASEESEGEEE